MTTAIQKRSSFKVSVDLPDFFADFGIVVPADLMSAKSWPPMLTVTPGSDGKLKLKYGKDDSAIIQQFVGVFVGKFDTRVLFKGNGTGDKPVCRSNDGKRGLHVIDAQQEAMVPDDTGNYVVGPARVERDCSTCPHSQYGSALDGGNGRACKHVINVAFAIGQAIKGSLSPDFAAKIDASTEQIETDNGVFDVMAPAILRISPTGHKEWNKMLESMSASGWPVNAAIFTVGCTKETVGKFVIGKPTFAYEPMSNKDSRGAPRSQQVMEGFRKMYMLALAAERHSSLARFNEGSHEDVAEDVYERTVSADTGGGGAVDADDEQLPPF